MFVFDETGKPNVKAEPLAHQGILAAVQDLYYLWRIIILI